MQSPATEPSSQPLAGVRVVDFSRYLPGPFCSMQLAQLGADVTSIERPPYGDPMRALPPLADDDESLFAKALHRRKTQVMADLNDPDDHARTLELCREADVVIETFRPGVADRLGIGYDQLRAINDSLVYCSISGYGQTGPWRDVPGHDANYLATCGLLDRIGPQEFPVQAPVPLADIAAGSMSATAICAALVRRERCGEGTYIDMSMTEAALSLQSHVFAAGPLDEGRRGRGVLNGDLACFDVYQCGDGRWLSVSAIEPHFWRRLCELLDLEQLVDVQNDRSQQDAIRSALSARLAARPAHEWHELLAEDETCTTMIFTMHEAAEHPQLVAREAIERLDPEADVAGDGRWQVPASPFVFDGERS